METLINWWAVLGGAVFLFVMGMIWYGPLFGKVWTKIMGAEHISKEEMAKMQKEMMPMYIITFILGIVTSTVLYIFTLLSGAGTLVAFLIWLGFSMPMAAGSMWDTQKGYKMKKFLVVAGYQLITLLVLGWAFMIW